MRSSMLALLLLAGCRSERSAPPPAGSGSGADLPASIAPERAAVLDEVVQSMERLANELHAARADCGHATKILLGSYDQAKRLSVKTASLGTESEDPAAQQWFQTKYAARFADALQKLDGVATACQQSDEFLKALDGYPLGKPK